jgi:hypothetical protein
VELQVDARVPTILVELPLAIAFGEPGLVRRQLRRRGEAYVVQEHEIAVGAKRQIALAAREGGDQEEGVHTGLAVEIRGNLLNCGHVDLGQARARMPG